MVGCDLARMALVAGIAVPAGPFWALCTLLVAAELLSAPFGAARAALLPEVLPDDRYVVASDVSNATIQGGQGLGFAAGGGLAAVLGTSATLALDAVTFGASAGLLWLGLRPRPAPPGPVTGIRSGSPLRSAAAGARLVGSDARLRALVGCAWLGYFFVVPEGLAGPLRRGSWRRCWHRGPADGGAAGRRGRWRGAARPTRRPGPAPWADEPAGRAVVRASARWRAAPWRRGQPGAVGGLRPRHVPPARRQLRLRARGAGRLPGPGPGVRARAVGHLRCAGSGHPRRRGRRPVRRTRCGGRGGRRRARSRHRADVELAGHGGWCGSALTTVALAQRRSAATGRWPSSITEQPPGTRARCAHVW